jgi:hypothetical protein
MVRLGTRRINCNLRPDPEKHPSGLAHVPQLIKNDGPSSISTPRTSERRRSTTTCRSTARTSTQPRFCGFLRSNYHYSTDHILRPVCSPRSTLPSLSPSSQNLKQTKPNGQKPTSARFSSVSTDPLPPTKTPPLRQRGIAPPPRSSRPRTFDTRVC